MDADVLTPALPPLPPPGLRVETPSAFYCTGEEFLRVTSFGSVASVALTLRARVLRRDGQIPASADRHVPNADRTAASTDHPLPDGWLLGCELFAASGSPRVGQVFVTVDVMRGSGAGATLLQTLAQGYVTDTQRLAWPGSLLTWSADGPGAIRSITGTDPGAGVEITETVPTNARWRLISCFFTLVTDATVANRRPVVVLDDGATTFYRVQSPANQTASTTFNYSASAADGGLAPLGTDVALPLPPDLLLMGGFRIRTSTVGIVAGDNYGAPQLLVEEWIED